MIVKNNVAICIAGKVSRYIDASMNRATPRQQASYDLSTHCTVDRIAFCNAGNNILRQITCTSSRVVKGVGHLGHDEAGGREFDPRPGHYSRMSF